MLLLTACPGFIKHQYSGKAHLRMEWLTRFRLCTRISALPLIDHMAVVSHRTTFDDEAARRLPPGGLNREPSLPG
jgi:hypothetical protein